MTSRNHTTEKTELEALREKVRTLETDFREAQDRIAHLYVLQEVAQTLTSELNLEPLLHKILASAVEVMNSSAGSLILLNELTDELVFAVIEGGGGEGLKGRRMPRDRGIAGWVASHQQPLIVNDVNQDDRYYQQVAQAFDFPLTSLLCVPMISRKRLIGVLQLMRSEPGRYFRELDQQLLITFANQAAIAIENARLYETLREERDRLVAVEDEIRKRLARDLHDGPTQLLASIVMSLSFIKKVIDRAPEQAPTEIDQTVTVADKALKQLRTLLFDLRPVILETKGLVPALELYVQRLRETDNLNIILTVERQFGRLSSRAEVAIFAVIQEAVNNAKKHANAEQLDIILRPDFAEDCLSVIIKDNGAGFDIRALENDYDASGSLGLINMQDRAGVVNGSLKIHSAVGQGTQVSFTLPLLENLKKENL